MGFLEKYRFNVIDQIKHFLYYPGSIQAKIFVSSSIVVLLSITTIAVFTYLSFSKTIEDNAIASVNNAIQHANQNFEIIFNDIDKISTVLIINEDFVIDPLQNDIDQISIEGFRERQQTEDFLVSLMAYKPYITRISVIGLDGKMFRTGDSVLFQSVMEESWFQKALSLDNKQILYDAPEQGGVSFSRIIRSNNQPLGVAMIDFDKTFINGLFHIEPVEGSMIFIRDLLGNYIVEPQENKESATLYNQVKSAIVDAHQPNNGHVSITAAGKTYLIVQHYSSVTNWFTYGIIPYDQLMQEATQIREQIIAISILICIVVLLFSIFVSRQITKNLRLLSASMSIVSKGLLTARPNIKSKDEISMLSRKFHSMMTTIHSLIEQIKEQEKKKREIELSALQSQIKPHFIYNTLSMIKNLASLQNVKNIEGLMESFIELLRMSLGHNREVITIREELEYLKNYLNIQQYKYLDNLTVKYQIDDELLDCKTLKFLLQPIVENALQHAFDERSHHLQIIIRIIRDQDGILMEVTDNGVGISASKVAQIMSRTEQNGDHLGIWNVNDRIQLSYGSEYGLGITSELGMYTAVEIRIPERREELS